jgi:hypothetical protein
MLLGAAVHEVVRHFHLQPPPFLEISDTGLRRLQTSLKSHVVAATRSHGGIARCSPPDYETLFQVPNMPEIPTQFDEYLGDMSRADIQQLLDDELDFLTFCSTFQRTRKYSNLDLPS